MISAYFSLFQPMVLQAANQQDLCDLHKPRHHDGEDTKTARPCKALHQSLQQNHGLRHLENLTILLELSNASNAIHTGSLCKYHCRNSLSFSGRIFSESRLPRLSEYGLLGFLEIRSLKAAPYKAKCQFQIEIGSFVSKPLIVSQLGRYARKRQVIRVIRGIQNFKVYLEDAAMLSISIDAIFPP